MMKVTAEGEGAIRACIRACRNSGGYLARIGDAAFQVIQRTATSPAFGPSSPQLVLWSQGDFPSSACLGPRQRVEGCPLQCGIVGWQCVARQIKSASELGKATEIHPDTGRARKSSTAKRGRVGTFPLCRTETCATGRRVRRSLGDLPESVRAAAAAPGCSDLGERFLEER